MKSPSTLSSLRGQPYSTDIVPVRFRPGQIAITVGFAVALWLLATLLIRYGGPMGLFGHAALALLFIATLPGDWLTILLVRRLAALRPDQIVAGIAVTSATAMLCDGFALAWARPVYGSETADLLPAAAWLLWTYGLALALAFLIARRAVH